MKIIGKRSCACTQDFHKVLSPSSVAKDSQSGEGFQDCLGHGCQRLQLAFRLPTLCNRRCWQKEVPENFTIGGFLDELYVLYICKTEVVPSTSLRLLLVLAPSHNCGADLNAPLPGRPCSLCGTIFHAAAKDRIAGERILSGKY